jgi:hypothetical protein
MPQVHLLGSSWLEPQILVVVHVIFRHRAFTELFDGPLMCGILVSAGYTNQNHDTEENQKQFNHVCSQLRMANALRGKLIFSSVVKSFPQVILQVLMPRALVEWNLT